MHMHLFFSPSGPEEEGACVAVGSTEVHVWSFATRLFNAITYAHTHIYTWISHICDMHIYMHITCMCVHIYTMHVCLVCVCVCLCVHIRTYIPHTSTCVHFRYFSCN